MALRVTTIQVVLLVVLLLMLVTLPLLCTKRLDLHGARCGGLARSPKNAGAQSVVEYQCGGWCP